MFTGLIQAIGTIKKNNFGVVVDGCRPFYPLKLGDSISVDGVCLTVSELMNDSFTANISEETLRRTNLAEKAQNTGFDLLIVTSPYIVAKSPSQVFEFVSKLAENKDRPDVIILDDAYQHLSLHRDLNLLLIDSETGFGKGDLLPLGILREPE